uniref:Uncharacterized protein n=1 Tax=Aegilops tauschii subsp. strangulata TaxID=200361 RepID=A0A453B636_AEGTS
MPESTPGYYYCGSHDTIRVGCSVSRQIKKIRVTTD